MSSTWYIHLKDDVFPHSTWKEVLRIFNATEKSPVQWNIQTKDGPTWLDLRRVKPPSPHANTFKWEIMIDVSGRGAHKYWMAYALGYWCLSLMEDASFLEGYDGSRLATPEDLERYADVRLKTTTGLSKLEKLGVLNSNESVQIGGAPSQWSYNDE